MYSLHGVCVGGGIGESVYVCVWVGRCTACMVCVWGGVGESVYVCVWVGRCTACMVCVWGG